jgi:hypothetical protein
MEIGIRVISPKVKQPKREVDHYRPFSDNVLSLKSVALTQAGKRRILLLRIYASSRP